MEDIDPVPPAEKPGRPARSRRRWSPGRWLVALVVLLPLAAAVAFVVWRAGEDALLGRARAQMARGELEAVGATLEPLRRRPLLSGEGRRGAAELYLRLGEDHKAHSLLVGQRPDPRDPRDRRLQELSARCQRAAALLHRADRSRDPEERVLLARAAYRELPEAPRVLQRVVMEELLAVAKTRDPGHNAAGQQAYAELKQKAPGLAAELKREVSRSPTRDLQ